MLPSPTCHGSRRGVVFVALICWSLLGTMGVTPALARPSALKLFPQETLLLVRTPNAHELVARLKQTANARLLADPELQPFIERLTGAAGELYTDRAAAMLGVSWEELQDLPQGELAFAFVARRDHPPAMLLLVDQGDAPTVARRLLDSALERLEERGGELSAETIDGVEITVIRDNDNQDRMIGLFEKEHTIVASTDAGLLREILRHWDDDDDTTSPTEPTDSVAEVDNDQGSDEELPQYSGRTLAENDKFVTILRHCRRPQDPPPNVIIFADPIGLLREFGRDNTGLKFAMATFPALGIDGLSGIGITQMFATDEYEDLSHMHVLLENPRAGVMQMIAFEPGDTSPQPWVPEAIETYMGWHWNVRTSFNTLIALADRVQYPGATDRFIAEKISEPLGIDFPAEVINNLAGRFTWFIGYDKPARFRGQQHVLAAELIDEAAAEKTLAAILARFPERFEARRFGDVVYHAILIPWSEQMSEEDRPIEPFVALMDGYFFIGGSCQLFERGVAARDGTTERLADSDEYRQLTNQVLQETPGVTPAVWMYSRFEETLRQWYDLLTSERTRDVLEQQSSDNPLFAALVDALAAGELPPFDVLARYAVPGGGVIYDTDSGLHGISFTLRNDPESDR